jgi:hypothetical protein
LAPVVALERYHSFFVKGASRWQTTLLLKLLDRLLGLRTHFAIDRALVEAGRL